MIDTCSLKFSVSLARIKIRLEFQSTKAFRQKMTIGCKWNAYLQKFRPENLPDHDVRLQTKVYKLFALH